jgi:hypothetical protein
MTRTRARLPSGHPTQQDGRADAAESVEDERARRTSGSGPCDRDAPGLELGIATYECWGSDAGAGRVGVRRAVHGRSPLVSPRLSDLDRHGDTSGDRPHRSIARSEQVLRD